MTTKTNLEPPSEQTSTTTPAQPPPSSASPLPAKRQRGRPATEVSCEQRDEIIRLSKFYKPRGIGRRVRLGRKVVERILLEEGIRVASDGPKTQAGPSTIKLAPFQQTIEELARKDLTITRILRTITNDGYQGGRTILADHVRALRTRLTLPPRTPPAKRRFETAPAEEMQIDWSPYLIPIGDRVVQVYALGCLLAYSRKLYLRCYRDERQATLLEGLASAFQYFDGVARRIVLDNMSTAVLGRLSADGKVLWHPRFVEFLTYYGCQPFACRVRDPDRKGKKEKSFRLVWDDFLKGTPFGYGSMKLQASAIVACTAQLAGCPMKPGPRSGRCSSACLNSAFPSTSKPRASSTAIAPSPSVAPATPYPPTWHPAPLPSASSPSTSRSSMRRAA
jgi:transposase